VVLDVAAAELGVRPVRHLFDARDVAHQRRHGVGARVAPGHEARRRDEVERRCIGTGDLDRLAVAPAGVALRRDEQHGGEGRLSREGRLAHLALVDAAGEQEELGGEAAHRCLVVRTREASGEVELAGRVSLEPEDEHPVRVAREGLAVVAHVADAVRGGRYRRVEVELAPVLRRLAVSGEAEPDVGEGLVRRLPQRNRHELRHRELFRLALLPLEEEPAKLRQGPRRALVRVVVRLADPERVDVELVPRLLQPAEDHRPGTAVADGERLDPGGGGLLVAEHELARAGLDGEGDRERGDLAGHVARHRGRPPVFYPADQPSEARASSPRRSRSSGPR